MRSITVHTGRDGATASVRESEEPGAWELEWTGAPEEPRALRILRNAETAALKNGGERVLIACSGEQAAMRAQLDSLPESTVSRTGDRYRMELMVPGPDGFIHDDDDFRTPLHRITCTTCVRRIAEDRTEKRQQAFGRGNSPREIASHTRLVAQAYTRLAEIEENLQV